MSAPEIMERLAAAGVGVRVEGEELVVRHKAPLSDTQRQYLQGHKDAILAHLRATSATEPSAPCSICGSIGWWEARDGGPWQCRRCHPGMPLTATTLALPDGVPAPDPGVDEDLEAHEAFLLFRTQGDAAYTPQTVTCGACSHYQRVGGQIIPTP
jgi:hypothetical protein